MTEQLTPEKIGLFLSCLREKGRGEASLKSYRHVLRLLYDWLPEDKRIGAETAPDWKAWLDSQELSPVTVDVRISVWNGLAQYLGHREWQLEEFHRPAAAPQPELSRAEYLRMLSAAKMLGNERSYLLVKVLGGAGMRVQELPQLTVEAVRRGTVHLAYHNSRQQRLLRLPELLRQELLDYIRREGPESGPVFATAGGNPLPRTRVYTFVRAAGQAACVPEEKATPRCLWKMYTSTQEEIRTCAALLARQRYDRMLEEEQLAVGWKA